MDLTPDIARGDRFFFDGVEYAVSHVKVDGKRGDINLIAVDEAIRRLDSLKELLGWEDN